MPFMSIACPSSLTVAQTLESIRSESAVGVIKRRLASLRAIVACRTLLSGGPQHIVYKSAHAMTTTTPGGQPIKVISNENSNPVI